MKKVGVSRSGGGGNPAAALRRGPVAVAVLCSLLLCLSGCMASKCSTCKSIVKQFAEGMRKTQGDGFGGGNTDWEERSLGAYATRSVQLQTHAASLAGEEARKRRASLTHVPSLLSWR